MSYESNRKQNAGVFLDVRYIFRRMKKNLLLILMCACLTGVGSYILLDHVMQDTYTASINLYVIPRDTAAGKMNDYNINAAIGRSVNVLNSATMRHQIEKSEEMEEISGTLSAASVPNSNVITMSASASSAEAASKLLIAGIEGYPSLSEYFEKGYLLKSLGHISQENITAEADKTLLYALAAAVLVLAAGLGLIGCMCLFSDRIYSMEQGEALLDMDMIGFLHYIQKEKEQKALLISDTRVDDVYKEEVDKIVTEVQRKMGDKQQQVLMVTGLRENDGKSTVAANLALNLSQRGKKVVLVDCDLRRPAVAKIFDYAVNEEKQFSLCLKGQKTLTEILAESKETGLGTSCIFQKKGIGNSDRLLANDEFAKAIDRLKAAFDYIILDTPPMGVVRDTEVIAEQCDTALMVMSQDEDRAAVLNDAVDILEDAGAEVIGGVLNMAKGERLSAKGYHGYRKYYNSYRNA